jgi:hypothetical protein
MTIVDVARCEYCERSIDGHSIEDARRCADALIEREATYCRLTGPKR